MGYQFKQKKKKKNWILYFLILNEKVPNIRDMYISISNESVYFVFSNLIVHLCPFYGFNGQHWPLHVCSFVSNMVPLSMSNGNIWIRPQLIFLNTKLNNKWNMSTILDSYVQTIFFSKKKSSNNIELNKENSR